MITAQTATTEGVIREFYATLASGEIEKAVEFLTPDFIMHVPGKGANAGEHWGREGFSAFVENILSYSGRTFSLDLRTVAVHENTVFTRELATLGRRQDPARRWALPFVMHYTMRNERVSEAWTIPEDLYLYDEYWDASSAPAPGVMTRPSVAQPSLSGGQACENLELLQTLYRYFWGGEFDRIRYLFAPDFVFFAPGRGYLSGTYRGWEGYLEFRHKLMAISGGKYRLDVDAIAASDTDVFAREFIRMNTTTHSDVQPAYVVMDFEIKDGRIVRANDFPVDLYDWERQFSA
jgi:ketosteroid isomerase-like protein